MVVVEGRRFGCEEGGWAFWERDWAREGDGTSLGLVGKILTSISAPTSVTQAAWTRAHKIAAADSHTYPHTHAHTHSLFIYEAIKMFLYL